MLRYCALSRSLVKIRLQNTSLPHFSKTLRSICLFHISGRPWQPRTPSAIGWPPWTLALRSWVKVTCRSCWIFFSLLWKTPDIVHSFSVTQNDLVELAAILFGLPICGGDCRRSVIGEETHSSRRPRLGWTSLSFFTRIHAGLRPKHSSQNAQNDDGCHERLRLQASGRTNSATAVDESLDESVRRASHDVELIVEWESGTCIFSCLVLPFHW